MFLLQQLYKKGHLSEADLRRAEEAIAASPERPAHEVLIEKGIGKEDVILQTLADEFGLELVDLSHATVSSETVAVMPSKLVHRRNLMPISRQNGTLVVATGDPYDVYALDELQ